MVHGRPSKPATAGSVLGVNAFIVGLSMLLLALGTAWAQEIGTIAEVAGTVEVGHAGAWTPAVTGAGVLPGMELRTGRPGRVRIVLQDGSVLTASDDAQLVIDDQAFDAEQGVARSFIRLVTGKLRALVSEYYERPRSVFQIETETAVAGVRGTDFVIAFDPVADVTDIVGVSGRAEVHSVTDRVGHRVFVTAKELTTVARGRYPTPPRRIEDELFRQYLGKLEFVGGGKAESFAMALPWATGAVVAEPDRATALPGGPSLTQAAAGGPAGRQPAAAGTAETAAEQPAATEPGGLTAIGGPLGQFAPILSDTVIPQTAGGVLGQPVPVIESTTGKLGIRF
jgi:hypothetical protein